MRPPSQPITGHGVRACHPNLIGKYKLEDRHPGQPKIKQKLILKITNTAGHRWLTPVILATQEAEIRRFETSPGK
jgi:hypothetical protein